MLRVIEEILIVRKPINDGVEVESIKLDEDVVSLIKELIDWLKNVQHGEIRFIKHENTVDVERIFRKRQKIFDTDK